VSGMQHFGVSWLAKTKCSSHENSTLLCACDSQSQLDGWVCVDSRLLHSLPRDQVSCNSDPCLVIVPDMQGKGQAERRYQQA